jgi:RND family efflux transporter MFP subunit
MVSTSPQQHTKTPKLIGRRRLARLGPSAAMVLATAIAACDSRQTTPAAQPPAVTVASPVRQQVTDYLQFTGNTAAFDSVTLVARVEGYLEQIHFTDGARVHKGDLLFTIQQDQYKAQLQQAKAQVAAQEAALWHAKTELGRYTDLVKEDSAPQTQVDRWQYERDSAAAALLAAQAQVELAKLNLSYTLITAPFDGRMGRHLVDPGNLVGAMGQQTNLAQIDRTDPLYVYFTIDERDLLRVLERRTRTPGHPLVEQTIPAAFGLLNEDSYPHQGKLDFASLSVAPTTGTLQVRAIFPNPEPGVLPGLFVRLRVPAGPPHDALLIPGDAISFDQQGQYVLLVNANDVVERRPIMTGTQVGDQFVVTDGLDSGDRVVLAGLARAIPGRKVMPEPAQPAVTPAAQSTVPTATPPG